MAGRGTAGRDSRGKSELSLGKWQVRVAPRHREGECVSFFCPVMSWPHPRRLAPCLGQAGYSVHICERNESFCFNSIPTAGASFPCSWHLLLGNPSYDKRQTTWPFCFKVYVL